MWILKEILSRLLFPIPLCLEFLAIGLLLLCFKRKQKTGRTVVALAGVLLFLFGSHSVSNLLLAPLESRYPPLFVMPGAPVSMWLTGVKFIVALGSGFTPGASRPVQMQLDDGSIARFVEGVRVGKLLSCCKLIVSGGPEPDGTPLMAQAMAQLAQELGVGRQDIILQGHSCDTEEQAVDIAPIAGKQPFILVTEATHIPCALALFRKQGTHPIADPMDFHTSSSRPMEPQELFPDAEELLGTQRAVYEYLGLASAKVRGRI